MGGGGVEGRAGDAAGHNMMFTITLSKGGCCSQVLLIVLLDDVETDVESCGLGWMLSTLLSLVFCGTLY